MEIILYAIIALVIAYRLYTVLGERNGGERTRPNPFSSPQKTDTARKQDEDVLAFPLSPQAHNPEAKPIMLSQPEPAPESLAGGLHAIAMADPQFEDRNFLKGARMAFEMIVHAFAAGEKGALKNLVSARLYDTFERAINMRESAGEKLDMKILSLRDADIVGARMEGSYAVVSIQFVSDQRKVVTDREGNVKDGGLEQLTDIWTFRRDTKSRDPNWMLVETKAI